MSLDPRVTPARGDLASRALEGVVPAKTYADPRAMTAIVPAAALRRAADPWSEQLDQVLFGEVFEVLEEAEGYAWGQARRDGYVGFVETAALAPAGPPATHRVAAIRTYAFAEPSIKSRALGPYSINSLVAVEAREGRFAKAANCGWFIEAHLAPIGMFETDPAAVAERFLGAPYLWGGRESLGVDCSGLVQQALLACGKAFPRDTDQQEAVGEAVEVLARGDLVFWNSHVAMMLDATRIIHANAFHMATAIEPLVQTRARYLANGVGDPTAYRRP
ncbi:C40 family peptidase [Phenylobacterium sp. LH3H17]|uniref:C40 family peptidase n=1 Tax=Phenylobacterium sp. LH3H17 TaxID=2903901 RepID=UPI0020C9E01F|nr:NlpC/P60 family protein [Phenylobacterium sp. LH3H17]UTP39223.1 C40 family peptidase [Phenylobacterium sp. LH3H17]